MNSNTATMPMPGMLRLRGIHPLIDGDGSCSLIYDVERAVVLDVPQELQFYVAPALETGDLDEDLLSWLVTEDLVTSERLGGFGQELEEAVGREVGGWWSLGSIHRGDGEVHSRIESASEASLPQALDFVFKQCFGATRVTLHLGWGGAFPGSGPLAAAVVEGCRRAAATRVEVAFELSLDVAAVTQQVVEFLVDYPYHVRLRCGAFPSSETALQPAAAASWAVAEKAARRLLAILPDRVTIECRLAGGARLLELWAWAKKAGVRHLDAVRFESSTWERGPSELRAYRGDLLAVYEDMCEDLEARRQPIAYQPLARAVRKLMRNARLAGIARPFEHGAGAPVGDSPAGLEAGETYLPGLPHLGLMGPDEGEAEAEGYPCRGCWARYICPHSALAAPPLASDRRSASRDRCAVWRTEVEVALRLQHRLAHADPVQVLRLFADALGTPGGALDLPGPRGTQAKAF
jgi:hypothetical protein